MEVDIINNNNNNNNNQKSKCMFKCIPIQSQRESLQDVIQEHEDNHQGGTKQQDKPDFLLEDCIRTEGIMSVASCL